jgi:hypothetical protein
MPRGENNVNERTKARHATKRQIGLVFVVAQLAALVF